MVVRVCILTTMTGGEKPFTVIESPFSAPTTDDLVRNVQYAMLAVRDSLERGEAPYASHLFYTQMLDDNDQYERLLGMDAGLTICRRADQTAVYLDLGLSRGMQYGIEAAQAAKRTVLERRLFDVALAAGEIDQLIRQEYASHDLPHPQTLEKIYGRIIK